MKLLDWFFGRYLANSEEQGQCVGPVSGISMLGLDALSSCAYGPEAALTVLLPLGAIGLHYAIPITCSVILLLFIVYLSYWQTIHAYPDGGGSYTVAKENLGKLPGLLAAAALLLDYILTVAVGISAGVGALISALPSLQPHTLALCLAILFLITIVNLRGIRESGLAFMLPTYLFLGSMFALLGFGVFKALVAGGHPEAIEILPKLSQTPLEAASFWLILRAFASGCTAMTGVEAVSNGMRAFRAPTSRNASKTLTAIIFILIILLGGISWLSTVYGIGATDPGQVGYESIVSQLIRAIVGRGWIYNITIGSVIAVLSLSASTSFADFPRLCQLIANDNYLPHSFSQRGRRLVFSHGIMILSILSAALLIFFDGVTDRLIPLYAIGAFLAFTLSQAGMVVHWWKQDAAPRPWLRLFINSFGAFATAITLIVILVSKFAEGGWITVVVIPLLLLTFYAIRRHYVGVAKQISTLQPLEYEFMEPPLIVVPIRDWNKTTRKALRFATQISNKVYAVHVESADDKKADSLTRRWAQLVSDPALKAGATAPQLVIMPSPYRRFFGAVLEFIDKLEAEYPHRRVAIVSPSLTEFKWYQAILHNQRAILLNAALYLRRDPKIILVTVPWFLES
jgi:amino acid transporter